jgi:aminopeptidase N
MALKKALAAYSPEQDKDPAYLQRLVEAQSKRDLEWFFDDWVYRDKGLPDFRVESAVPRATLGGAYIVTVTIENIGNAGAEVPVKLVGDGGEVTMRLQVPAKGKTSIRIEIPSAPQQVEVNDGSVPESALTNNSLKISAPAADK